MRENYGKFSEELKGGFDPMTVKKLTIETENGQRLEMNLSALELTTVFLALGIEITNEGWTGYPDEQLEGEIIPLLQDGTIEEEKTKSYADGYKQCLEDVYNDGIRSAEKIANSETLIETMKAAYKGE